MMDMGKCACQVTALVAARIPRNAFTFLVESVENFLPNAYKVAPMVARDPSTITIQPKVCEVTEVICQPNIRQFIITWGLLETPPPDALISISIRL